MPKRYNKKYLLEINNLTKQYGDLTAVDDVSLNIEPGEIFALLGPNGAGKTTLIGCIAGLITRFSGDIQIAGYDVLDNFQTTRRLVGLVPQELNYDAFLNVREILDYQGGYFGKEMGSERVDKLLKRFSLYDKVGENTRWLSGGMKRRLMICKALMHQPVLLFLDEPTAGVDVELREELWDYVRQLRKQGTTILLTTHYIEEAEALADRVGILKDGELLTVSPKEQLMNRFGTSRIDVQLTDEIPSPLLNELENCPVDKKAPKILSIRTHQERGGGNSTLIDRVLDKIYAHDCSIEHIDGRRSSLEEIFRNIIAGDSKDK